MKKSEISHLPVFYDRYIDQVPDMEITEALSEYGKHFLEEDLILYEQLGDQVYETGKWTIKEIIQHIIDTERIFSYRALRLARFDPTPLPGFDENFYAKHAPVHSRELNDLITEWVLLRQANILMYKGFSTDQLKASGMCNEVKTDVVSLGFAMVGHVIHHKNIIRERYLTLLESTKKSYAN